MKSIKEKIFRKFWSFLPIDHEAKNEAKLDKTQNDQSAFADEKHLKETANWICRAQDSSSDSGVARAYKAAKYKGHGQHGWQASYPETTGYIIPTMLALANSLPDPSYASRAIKMADWEIDIQMKSGAVMGSIVTAAPSPAVFNTGQVIFGWLAAYNKTGAKKYLDSATQAGDYLLSVQGEDGSWHKGDSNFALKSATTYNTRVAWALAELGLKTHENKYIASAKKNIELALSKQKENGWFADNCLNDPNYPLLHTIVYATRGILETGIALKEDKYIEAAQKSLDSILDCQRSDGGIPGRLNSGWQSAANWDCLTGDAQAAIAWLRLSSLTNKSHYKDAARNAIEFIKKSQNLKHPNPGIKGGVKGSFPFDGLYGQFEMLNWAAKFFCDALMLINDSNLLKKGIKG